MIDYTVAKQNLLSFSPTIIPMNSLITFLDMSMNTFIVFIKVHKSLYRPD